MQTTHPAACVDEFFDPESLREGINGVEHPLIRGDAEHRGVYFGVTVSPGDPLRGFRLIVGARSNQPHPDDTLRERPEVLRFIYYVHVLDDDECPVGDELIAAAGTDWWSPWTTIVELRQCGINEVGPWLQRIPEFRDGL
jgi:hypothetical protein